MYHEFGSNTSRNRWQFSFRGNELLPRATELVKKYRKEEEILRREMAALMADKTVAASDNRIDRCRKEIERVCRLHEECLVYELCFEREADREFHLSLGDVVFFGLV